MAFSSQTAAPAGAIVVSEGGAGTVPTVDLAAVAAKIDKLVFAAGLDGQGAMRGIRRLSAAAVRGEARLPLETAGSDFADGGP
jgi:stress response protein SCP2